MTVEDPTTKQRAACESFVRWGWLCGLCHGGWLRNELGAKCRKCDAVVVEREPEAGAD